MRTLVSKYLDSIVLAFLCVVAFAGTALAAGAIAPDDASLLDLARPVFDAIVHGQWWVAAASALILVVAAARKYAPTEGRFAWMGRALASTPGVMATTFVLSFAGATATALLALGASGAMSWPLAKTALLVAVTAIGAWRALHSLATWAVATEFYKSKVPAWAQSLVAALLALIGSNAIAKANAAGQKAVDAKPATGAASDDSFTKF